MESTTFTGWVRHIFDATEYRQDIVVANYADERMKDAIKSEKKSFPRALRISANVKNGAYKQLEGLNEGDKVKVTFFLGGVEGISKSKNTYYAINELLLAKQDGIEVLERAEVSHEDSSENDEIPDDIPF